MTLRPIRLPLVQRKIWAVRNTRHAGIEFFWACLLGVLPITLIYVGGIGFLKSAVTVSSVPLFVIVLLVTLSLCKSLAAHQQTDR